MTLLELVYILMGTMTWEPRDLSIRFRDGAHVVEKLVIYQFVQPAESLAKKLAALVNWWEIHG